MPYGPPPAAPTPAHAARGAKLLSCDRDPTARALVVANLPGTYFEVHLCGHHARTHLPVLLAQGWAVLTDAREDGVNAWTGSTP